MHFDNNVALVCLLARVRPSAKCIERANEIIGRAVDWKKVFKISGEHGVAPLVYRNIGMLTGVSPEIAEHFKRAYLFCLGNSAKASRDLMAITETLKANVIEAVALKGLLVADEVFGDVASYPSSDIDLLIRRKDVSRVFDVMAEEGYASESGTDAFYLDHYADLDMCKEGNVPVEFHLRLGSKRYFTVPEAHWWEDLRSRSYDGVVYTVLSKEKCLLFAALHLFEHGCAPLKFIVGVAEMLRVYEDDIEWERFMESAKALGVHNTLLLSCFLASELLEAPLHPVVKEWLYRCSPKELWIFRKIKRYVFQDVRFSTVMFLLTLLQFNIFEVFLRMIQWVFPSIKEISFRYELPSGSKRVYFYYFMNPLFLLLKKRK